MTEPAFWVHPLSDCEPGAEVGRGTKIWRFCHVMRGARIGDHCSLGQGCFVADGARLGDRVRLQNHVSVFSGVHLEDDVFCGPGVVFSNVDRPRAFLDRRGEFHITKIARGASLGANATICPGVTVGEYALVGAGAVVTHDVAAHAQVVGVPARQVAWVSRAGERLHWDAEGRACCPRAGDEYLLDEQGQLRCLSS